MTVLSLVLAACQNDPPREPAPAPPDPTACFRELVTTLSTDEMGGRGIGTEGLTKAGRLLEERFRAAGLGDGGMNHRQVFEAVTGVEKGPGNKVVENAQATLGDDEFTPLGFSSNGEFAGDVVWAGYGITAPELGYDDYAGLDVKGKVVLVMRYEPGETDEKSPFDGKRASRWSDLRLKAMKARELGAAALVFVAPPRQPDEPDKLPPMVKGGPTSRAGIPVIQITRAVADRWLARAGGSSLFEAREAIDGTFRPASFPIPGLAITGTTDVTTTKAETANVVGVIPGEGALANQVVVVGAHYDHLGMGEEGSMRPDSHAIHNGADDNASGTAAMVCAVEQYAKAPPKGDRRTIVALAFSAEEIGLGGSSYYTDHPVLPLEETVGMVNLDMVGRVRDHKISALGSDTAPEWADLLTAAGTASGLDVKLGGDGYGPSDHSSFFEKQLPVIHLFSGTHEQYHTPDDDAGTLEMEGGGRVVTLLGALLEGLTTPRTSKLTYVRSTNGPPMMGDSRGYGASLGTVPDMTADEAALGGVRLADVRAGGAAEKAGLQAGDVLVGLAGARVQNLYDMSFCLQDHKPGETVDVVVKRDGKELTLRATLTERKGGGPPGSGPGGPNNRTDHGDFNVGAEPPAQGDWRPTAGKAVPEMIRPDETHLADLRQLTFGGENAEAYWGPDGRRVMLQRTPVAGATCDQEYTLDLTTGEMKLFSSGKGRTTCGYFDYPDGRRNIYATTEAAGPECPPVPDHSQGYVWPLYDTLDLVWQAPGGKPEPFLAAPGYDAEATLCHTGGKLVFTSTRDGDLDLYTVNVDGTNLERQTDTKGYDGGAFFNAGCTALVWRASRPEGEALADYEKLLAQDLVRPSALEIFWMDLATKKVEQLTSNGAANFAPFPVPGDEAVLYSSNEGGNGREFDVWMVGRDGGKPAKPAKVTTAPGFDGFPMFSPDGKWLMFASNRATPAGQSDTNLFVARWVP